MGNAHQYMEDEEKICIPENYITLNSEECWKCEQTAKKNGFFKYGSVIRSNK